MNSNPCKITNVNDNTYTFIDSEDNDVFYFYRTDGGIIAGDINSVPVMDYYLAYISMTPNMNISDIMNVSFAMSDDQTTIRLTVNREMKDEEMKDEEMKDKKTSNPIKRFFHFIFD